MTETRQGLRPSLIAIAVAVVVIAGALLILHAIAAQHESDCHAMGGHLERHHAYKSVTYICLTPDGRVLKIW